MPRGRSRKTMRHVLHIIALLALVAGLCAAQQGPAVEEPQQDAPTYKRVQFDVVVVDAEGKPMPRVMVQAQTVGDNAASLTDNEGRCGLTLKPGRWVIKVIRLPEGELLRQVIEIDGEQEEIALPLRIGGGGQALPDDLADSGIDEGDDYRSVFADAGDATEIRAESLGQNTPAAVAELAKFSESVLIEARHKILDKYAANSFNTSYWIDQTKNLGSDRPGTAGKSYRLNLDWNGNIVNAGRQRVVDDLLSSASPLRDVPVNVDISVSSKNVNADTGNFDFGPAGNAVINRYNQSSPDGVNVSTLPSLVGRFLAGGRVSPEDNVGYDLRPGGDRLSVRGNTNFRAFYNEINNHIVDLYRPLRTHASQSIGTDEAIRGVEFGVEQTFMGGFRATVEYSYTEAGGLDIRTVNLHFEEWQDFENFLENGLRHELSTSIQARLNSTDTRFRAVYRLYPSDFEDVTVSQRVSDLFSEHSRIDLSLNQKINFGILSSARISFNLAVNNLLNSTRNSQFVSPDLEEEYSNRKLLGGIRIEF
jgi:hypothetical protein